ncbi:MAG: hypothetical protein J5747_13750 [Spirochaetaceae bacterium]|nr:hypothetical protein [Spirochaetaceae bacterium]
MKNQKENIWKTAILLFVCSILLCGMFTSCTTPPIKEIPEVEDYQVSPQTEKSSLEFFGFKMDTRNLIYDQLDIAKSTAATNSFQKLGYKLEQNNLAVDKSNDYFGLYDLQEFQNYKNTERFITFIEIDDNSLKYEISGKSKIVWGILSGVSISTGVIATIGGIAMQPSKIWLSENTFTYDNAAAKETADLLTTTGILSSLIGVGLLIPALMPPKTTAIFNGTYSIYVYDMQTHSVIRRDTIPFKKEAEFKGAYIANKESQDKVMEYYSKLISNEILQKYEEIARWLKTLE